MALGHDIGHTAFGHEGENNLKLLAIKYGLGTFAHNIQGALLLQFISNKNIPEAILDGIQCHNGESGETEVFVNYNKSPEDRIADLKTSLAKPKFERTQVPGSHEGATFKLIDKISYVAQDLADGFKEKYLDPRNIDHELRYILNELGLSDERIKELLSQDIQYVNQNIQQVIDTLQDLPIQLQGNDDTKITNVMSDVASKLQELQSIPYTDKETFDNLLSRVSNKLKQVASSPKISASSSVLLHGSIGMLNELVNQDTSGGILAYVIEQIFINDLIENSKGLDHPKMSEGMGDLMYDLIGYTQENVIAKSVPTEEQMALLRTSTEQLIIQYANMLLASGVIDEIYPEYSEEVKDANKGLGIWDDIETYKKPLTKSNLKIVGHTRKLIAQNSNYLSLVKEAILMASENEGSTEALSYREKFAMKIGSDYYARNDEKQSFQEFLNHKITDEKQATFLNTRQVQSKTEILPNTNLYHTRTGMQKDRMDKKLSKLTDFREYADQQNEPPSKEVDATLNEAINTLSVIRYLYDGMEDFDQKKIMYLTFLKQYSECRQALKGVIKEPKQEPENDYTRFAKDGIDGIYERG